MYIAEVRKSILSSPYPGLKEISSSLDKVKERLQISLINWKEFNYQPLVSLAMAYSNNEIFLKFYVEEDSFKAEKAESNQMVCEDSCVECFFSPADDGIYYNLEFNGIGTCLMGSGNSRENNTLVDPLVISKIRRLTSKGRKIIRLINGKFRWTITIAIPFSVFIHHNVKILKGKTFMANFYKCGDLLPVPHYLTWNPVHTKNPDFHQPIFFGRIKFI